MSPPAQDPAAARLRNLLEALLMAADRPLEERALQALLADHSPPPNQEQLCSALRSLQEEYAERGVTLRRVAGGYRFQVCADYASWVHRLEHVRQPRYSRAVLETLAIIAYRQPVTRGEIERIRGITVNTGVLRVLLGRRWVRVVGHKEVPGRPELLATTREFLDYFNLRSLGELPELPAAPELPEALELPLEEEGETGPGESTAEGAEGGALPGSPGSLVAEDAGDEVDSPSPANEDPANEGPANEGPANEDPANEDPANEDPANEGPANEDPANEGPANEGPANEGPANEDPANEGPANEDPANEDPANEDPANEDPANEDPANEDPVEEEMVAEGMVAEGMVAEGSGGEVAVVSASPEEASPEEVGAVFTVGASGAGAVGAEAAVGLVAEGESSAESSVDRAAAAGVVPLVEPAPSIPPSEAVESGLLLGEERDGLHRAKRVPGEDGVAD